MSTVTLHISDEKHERLQHLAKNRGISLDQLVDEWATQALTESDAKSRFMNLAARGNPSRGLALLDKLDHLEELEAIRAYDAAKAAKAADDEAIPFNEATTEIERKH